MFLCKDVEKWDWRHSLTGISKELMMSYFLNWAVGLRVFFSLNIFAWCAHIIPNKNENKS